MQSDEEKSPKNIEEEKELLCNDAVESDESILYV